MGIITECRLGLYEKAMPGAVSWEEKLCEAKKAGFDFLEMSIDETEEKLDRLDWNMDQIWQIGEIQRKADFYIESICFSAQRKFPLGSRKWGTESLHILKKAVILAKKMGIRVIQLQGYDCFYDEISNASSCGLFYHRLKEAAMFASAYGIVLALETMETEFMNTVEKTMKGIRYVDSPYLQIYPDVGNLYNAQKDVVSDLNRGKGHIAAAHLKETVPGKFREIPYGEGQVDFPVVIAELYRLGVRRFVAEFWYDGGEEWQQNMKKNKDFLTKQMKKAGDIVNEKICVGT